MTGLSCTTCMKVRLPNLGVAGCDSMQPPVPDGSPRILVPEYKRSSLAMVGLGIFRSLELYRNTLDKTVLHTPDNRSFGSSSWLFNGEQYAGSPSTKRVPVDPVLE